MQSSPNNASTYIGIACGLGAGALWGLMFLAPELVRSFTPVQIAIGRYLAYGAISWALLAPRWASLRATLTRSSWLSLIGLALVGNTFFYVALASAVQNVGVAATSLILGFMPVLVTVIGSRQNNAVPLQRLIPSLALCAAGALCIGSQALLLPSSRTAISQLFGVACAVTALLSWTLYAVFNTKCLTIYSHISAQDWGLLIGLVTGAQALCLLPISLLSESFDHGSSEWMRFAAVTISVAVLGSILGTALWNRMSRLLPLTLVGQMIVFETVFALLYGFLWENRTPTALEGCALIFVVASVVTCISAHRHHETTVPQPNTHQS